MALVDGRNAETAYESSVIVRAYNDRELAAAFSDKCSKYNAKAPTLPDDENEYEAFDKKRKRWESRHPAGKDCLPCDSFGVYQCKLYKENQ